MKSHKLSHLDKQGRAQMVDVGQKDSTEREATAVAHIAMDTSTLKLIREGGIKKGEVFATARIAGIMAAKRTPELIPLCHPLELTHVEVRVDSAESDRGATAKAVKSTVRVQATVKNRGRTGVEMEAMVAASVAALTIYDMCKGVDREMTIEEIYVASKTGGRSGPFEHPRAKKIRELEHG